MELIAELLQTPFFLLFLTYMFNDVVLSRFVIIALRQVLIKI